MNHQPDPVIPVVLMLFLWGFLILLYWAPWIIAMSRRHRDVGSIFVLNFFLGWTFIGWVGALAWACSGNVRPQQRDADMTNSSGGGSTLRYVVAFVCIAGVFVIGALFVISRSSSVNPFSSRETNVQTTAQSENIPTSPAPILRPSPQRADSMMNLYTNARYGFSIQYPTSFKSQPPPENGDGLEFLSEDGRARLVASGINNLDGDTTETIYQSEISRLHGSLGYNTLKPAWFVITWQDGDTIGYEKTFVGSGSTNSFIFTFPKSQEATYSGVVTSIEKSFRPGDISHAQ